MESFASTYLIGLVALAAVAGMSAIGIEPAAAATAGILPAVDVLALQLFDTVIEILDRVADLLNEINRVVSEFSQLFGEGGED